MYCLCDTCLLRLKFFLKTDFLDPVVLIPWNNIMRSECSVQNLQCNELASSSLVQMNLWKLGLIFRLWKNWLLNNFINSNILHYIQTVFVLHFSNFKYYPSLKELLFFSQNFISWKFSKRCVIVLFSPVLIILYLDLAYSYSVFTRARHVSVFFLHASHCTLSAESRVWYFSVTSTVTMTRYLNDDSQFFSAPSSHVSESNPNDDEMFNWNYNF